MRLSKEEKTQLAQSIKDKAFRILDESGTNTKVSGELCREVEYRGLKILWASPFTKYEDKPGDNMLDIWEEGKVFSVGWKPFKITTFRYGDWMNIIVPGSYAAK